MDKNLINDYVAGAIAGMAGLVCGHPLDTAKVQMQTRKLTRDSYSNTMDAIRNLYGNGWRLGLLRGLSFPLLTYGLINCIFFGVYGNTLRFIEAYRSPSSSRSTGSLDIVVAGTVAGLVQLTVACPVEVVKVILQGQIGKEGRILQARGEGVNSRFPGPIYCLRQLYVIGGLSNCYRGLIVMSLRDVPASAIYFVTYDRTKARLGALGFGDDRGLASSLVAGGWAGVVSWTAIIPLDVVKSHFQMDFDRRRYRGLWDCVRTVYRAGGPSAFFAGSMPCLIRAFATNAVILTVNAECLRLLRSY